MNELMEPSTCDWCESVFEYALGGYVGSDHVCTECLVFSEEVGN